MLFSAAVFALGFSAAIAASEHAFAEPSLTEIEQQVEQLEQQMVVAAEEYHQAQTFANTSRDKQAQLQPRVTELKAKVAERQAAIDALAGAIYGTGGIDAMSVLLATGTPQTALDQLSLVQLLHEQRKEKLDELLVEKRKLDREQRLVDQEVTEQTVHEQVLKDRQAKINQDLVKWDQLRARLTGQSGRTGRFSAVPYQGQGLGKAAVALRYAFEQQKKPYRFASAGPSAFDCSGLTMAAWQRAGVSMEHSARVQYASFPKVPINEVQPGDLVFYGSPIHHVAMYAGDGKVIHAPAPGDVVKVVPMAQGGGTIIGAVRPG